MLKRPRILKGIVLTMSALLLGGMAGCSSKTSELTSEDVTLITKVLPQGEVVYAVVCDFGDNIDTTNINRDSIKVESAVGKEIKERTITKIYSNDKIEADGEESKGQYLVIELNPMDENSMTTSFDPVEFLSVRNELKYTVTFLENVKTEKKTFMVANKGILNGNEVIPVVDEFEKLTFNSKSGKELKYRFFQPQKENDKKYPLVLFLHGAGERGTDNTLQMIGNEGALTFAYKEDQEKNPCYILAPQSDSTDKLTFYWTEEERYNAVLELVRETMEKYSIDENRVYIVGMSMGGIGTWNIIEKNPDLFAAAVPICGVTNYKAAGDPYNQPIYAPVNEEHVEILKNIPIWAFHGVDDPVVDVRNSREMYEAIKKVNGNLMKYTELPEGTSHLSWIQALQDKDMKTWLFNQVKK